MGTPAARGNGAGLELGITGWALLLSLALPLLNLAGNQLGLPGAGLPRIPDTKMAPGGAGRARRDGVPDAADCLPPGG